LNVPEHVEIFQYAETEFESSKKILSLSAMKWGKAAKVDGKWNSKACLRVL
jgi:hypothetical protein